MDTMKGYIRYIIILLFVVASALIGRKIMAVMENRRIAEEEQREKERIQRQIEAEALERSEMMRDCTQFKVRSVEWYNHSSEMDTAQPRDRKYDIACMQNVRMANTSGALTIESKQIVEKYTVTTAAYLDDNPPADPKATAPAVRKGPIGQITWFKRGDLFKDQELVKVAYEGYSGPERFAVIEVWTMNSHNNVLAYCNMDTTNIEETDKYPTLVKVLDKLEELRQKYPNFNMIVFAKIEMTASYMRELFTRNLEPVYKRRMFVPSIKGVKDEEIVGQHLITDAYVSEFIRSENGKDISAIVNIRLIK